MPEKKVDAAKTAVQYFKESVEPKALEHLLDKFGCKTAEEFAEKYLLVVNQINNLQKPSSQDFILTPTKEFMGVRKNKETGEETEYVRENLSPVGIIPVRNNGKTSLYFTKVNEKPDMERVVGLPGTKLTIKSVTNQNLLRLGVAVPIRYEVPEHKYLDKNGAEHVAPAHYETAIVQYSDTFKKLFGTPSEDLAFAFGIKWQDKVGADGQPVLTEDGKPQRELTVIPSGENGRMFYNRTLYNSTKELDPQTILALVGNRYTPAKYARVGIIVDKKNERGKVIRTDKKPGVAFVSPIDFRIHAMNPEAQKLVSTKTLVQDSSFAEYMKINSVAEQAKVDNRKSKGEKTAAPAVAAKPAAEAPKPAAEAPKRKPRTGHKA
mgnify:CR=1 FL=1